MEDEVDARISADVQEINRLASDIAALNSQIGVAQGQGAPNDLLDQRGELLRQLADLTAISTVVQDGGPVNVFTSGGHPLVVGGAVTTLSTTPDVFNPTILQVSDANGAAIAAQIDGGSLGGILQFREQILEPRHQCFGPHRGRDEPRGSMLSIS